LYPDGTVAWPVKGVYPGDKVDPRDVYYGWLADRRNHGLKNTVDEFTGFFDSTTGYDEFLTKNWKYWDLVKFIVGYEWWNPNAGGDYTTTAFITPEVLRMSGFPLSHIVIGPSSPRVDWAVGLPPNIAKPLTDNFPNANILFGPGYSFGLYSCGDGLTKDGFKEAHVTYMGMYVNLMRKD
jgi:hypothetical protein